jgi:hypothetical protein
MTPIKRVVSMYLMLAASYHEREESARERKEYAMVLHLSTTRMIFVTRLWDLGVAVPLYLTIFQPIQRTFWERVKAFFGRGE